MAPATEEGAQLEDLEGDNEEEEVPCRRPPGHGSSSLPPQKPPLPSASCRPAVGCTSFKKRTRDLPNLCSCHRCGLRFPDKGRREQLQPLESQWRIVLLCKACLAVVRSAQVCSYCFLDFGERAGGFVRCRECSCRVHLGCLPEQRGYLAPSDLDPELFTCVDCCAFPVTRVANRGKGGGCSNARVSDISVENGVKNVKRDDVKNVAAKNAAGLVRDDLDLVLEEKFSTCAASVPVPGRGELDLVLAEKLPSRAAVLDEELALRLHRSMNGSQRISRGLFPASSDHVTGDRRGLSNVNLLDKGSESGNYSICGEVMLCTEDGLLETMEIIDAKPLNAIDASEGNFFANLDLGQKMYQRKKVTLHSNRGATGMVAREKQATYSEKLVKSAGGNIGAGCVSVSCPRAVGPNTVMCQQDEKHSMPDRYLKKYCKRPPRMKPEG